MASDPREREGKVGSLDLSKYREEAASLRARLDGAGSDEARVWEVYARAEKLIAVLKFRLEFETPGVFVKLPEASEPSRLLEEASVDLSRSADLIADGRLVESLNELRKARNNLRSFLTERRSSATRSGRSKR